MNIEDIREYCLRKKASSESFPFDELTLVFKVRDKMFALTSLDNPNSINLKCDPEKAIELRERYDSVSPGFHMNKRLWNTVRIDLLANDELLKQWIDDSYRLVIEKMPKKYQAELLDSLSNKDI